MASRKPTKPRVPRDPNQPAPAGDPFPHYRELDWQRLDSSHTVAALDVETAALDPEDDR